MFGVTLKYSILLAASVFVALPVAAQNVPRPVVVGERLEVHSRILDENRPVIVGKPRSYERAEEAYSVLYLLDGGAHFQHTVAVAHFLASNDRIPELLVVAIANTDRSRDLTPYSQVGLEIRAFPTQGGADRFRRFLIEELMPWVENNYRTRPYRILIGHSFGGLFAIESLLADPESFNAYLAISPSLQWDNQSLVSRAEKFFGSHQDLNATLFMTVGNERGPLLGGMRKLAGILEEKAPQGFRWEFTRHVDQTHNSVPLPGIYEGLERIYDDWYLKDAMATFDQSGIEAVEDYYVRGGARFGYERKTPIRVLTELEAMLIEANRLDEAVTLMTHDPDTYPLVPQLVDLLVAGYLENGGQEAAIESLTNILSVRPDDAATKEALANLASNGR